MTPDRWRQIEQVYHAALEREEGQRAAYLRQACAGDDELHREVESLLEQDTRTDGFLRPVGEIAEKVLAEDPTRSWVGKSLGSYKILSLLGAGGMGEVYEARDSKLGRRVAIKVLPAAFVDDPERVVRFQREARMLAALNHPNIAAIYGLADSGNVHALVLELVEGPTLADRIKQGPIPVDEALRISRQITEALEYAHERGIVHRDLKPANVKVTSDDEVKILDFGLAKAIEGDGSSTDITNSPTISQMATRAGVLLGTAAYMSPEQAKGRPVDRRADIWAFGCVLYEMLTQRMVFARETVTDTLAAVIKEEPDWPQLPSTTPVRVRVLLQRCLQKDPKQRLRDIGDARISLDEVLTGAPEPSSIAAAPVSALLGRRTLIAGLAALLLVATIASLVTWNLKPALPPKPVSRLQISLPPGQRLDLSKAVAISPDGTHLVYSAGPSNLRTRLYIREMDGLEARPISGTEGAHNPFFSPDGQWIGFGESGGKLMKLSLSGGAPVSLADVITTTGRFGASWGSQGIIAFVPNGTSPLQQIPDTGGNPQPLTRLEKGESSHFAPDFLPGGKGMLFAALASGAPTKLVAQSLTTGERRDLIRSGGQPRYAASGHLVYAQGANLMAAPFDPQRLAITGTAIPVVAGVLFAGGVTQYDFSSTGSLIYVPSSAQAAQFKLLWVDRKGAEQPVPAPAHNYVLPRVSPDGKRGGGRDRRSR